MQTIFSYTVLLALFLHITSHAQTIPAIEWQKCLGGSLLDNAVTVLESPDGGYVVAGNTYSIDGDVIGNHGGADFWLVKLSITGEMEWQKCLGGTLNDLSNSLLLTNDGGYVLIGETSSNDGDISGFNGGESDFWVVKLDSNINIEWQKCFGGSGEDEPRSVKQTIDGGYILAGLTNSIDNDVIGNHGGYDVWVLKLDHTGNIEWKECYGGAEDEAAYFIDETTNGGFILAGATYSNDGDVSGNHGNEDYWIVKLSATGYPEWQKCFGGTTNDICFCIQQTNDGGYIAAGAASSQNGDVIGNHGDYDYWILKLDNAGNIEWQKCLGGSDTQGDWARFIQQTSSGGFIIAGYSGSDDGDVTGNHGYYDHWVVMLNNGGDLEWQKSLGGSKHDYGRWITESSSGGYVLAGNSFSDDGDVSGHHDGNHADFWVVKLSCSQFIFYADADSDGYGNINESQFITDCSAAPAGYVSDSTDCDDGNPGVYPGAVEITGNGLDDDCDGSIDGFGVGINEQGSLATILISPDPADDHFTMTLSLDKPETMSGLITITDVAGKKILQRECVIIQGKLKEEFYINNKFQAGLYHIGVVTKGKVWKTVLMVQ